MDVLVVRVTAHILQSFLLLCAFRTSRIVSEHQQRRHRHRIVAVIAHIGAMVLIGFLFVLIVSHTAFLFVVVKLQSRVRAQFAIHMPRLDVQYLLSTQQQLLKHLRRPRRIHVKDASLPQRPPILMLRPRPRPRLF